MALRIFGNSFEVLEYTSHFVFLKIFSEISLLKNDMVIFSRHRTYQFCAHHIIPLIQ